MAGETEVDPENSGETVPAGDMLDVNVPGEGVPVPTGGEASKVDGNDDVAGGDVLAVSGPVTRDSGMLFAARGLEVERLKDGREVTWYGTPNLHGSNIERRLRKVVRTGPQQIRSTLSIIVVSS